MKKIIQHIPFLLEKGVPTKHKKYFEFVYRRIDRKFTMGEDMVYDLYFDDGFSSFEELCKKYDTKPFNMIFLN